MYKLLVVAAVLSLASANLKELLAGGGGHHDHHHGEHPHHDHHDHHGEHHDHHGEHHDHHDGHHDGHHAHHEQKEVIEVISQDFETDEDGTFNSQYETENGIKNAMSGENKVIGGDPEKQGIVMRGSYTYTTPEDQTYTVVWVADEEGFKPVISK